MNTSSRRVTVFTVLGVLLAVLVGVAVWAGSGSSHSDRAGFTADAAGGPTGSTGSSRVTGSTQQEATTAASSLPHTTWAGSPSSTPGSRHRSAAAAQPIEGDDPEAIGAALSNAARASAPQGYTAENDPFMPPYAVVNPGASSAEPSRVYRPSNIAPVGAETAPEPAAPTMALTTEAPSAPSQEDEQATSSTVDESRPEQTLQPVPPASGSPSQKSDTAKPSETPDSETPASSAGEAPASTLKQDGQNRGSDVREPLVEPGATPLPTAP